MKVVAKVEIVLTVDIADGWDPKCTVEQISNNATQLVRNRVAEVRKCFQREQVTITEPNVVSLTVEQTK